MIVTTHVDPAPPPPVTVHVRLTEMEAIQLMHYLNNSNLVCTCSMVNVHAPVRTCAARLLAALQDAKIVDIYATRTGAELR